MRKSAGEHTRVTFLMPAPQADRVVSPRRVFAKAFFVASEMSGTGEEISQVHWKQQWLENGTLYFHVSMTESEILAQTTQATAREPAHGLHEHMHLLHISVMVTDCHGFSKGGLIALLLLILLFTLVLYTRHRWCKRRRIPQKSASTEATHEIHYIPSVLLGPQGRDSYRGSRGTHQHGNSVIGMPIRETPILDDYDCDEEDTGGHSLNSTPNQLHTKLCDGKAQEDYGVNIGIGGHTGIMCKDNDIKHHFEKRDNQTNEACQFHYSAIPMALGMHLGSGESVNQVQKNLRGMLKIMFCDESSGTRYQHRAAAITDARRSVYRAQQ
ncbi:Astrotactin-2 [Liparis tanakae]|uniref:Astrotactin-2 n=1 Tax=Liparis tanakae TaxID=230148 RepID=A0A4Z2J0J1_9TELE|nr:Astrotactin-2 [Liparis tanakae]